MQKKELESRTKRFALSIVKLVTELPRRKVSDVIGYPQFAIRNSYDIRERPLCSAEIPDAENGEQGDYEH
jgi:hypothetical protein